MATVQVIAEILDCTNDTAQKIHDTMYQWVSPDWSASSKEDLRIDLMVAAECEGIKVVKNARSS